MERLKVRLFHSRKREPTLITIEKKQSKMILSATTITTAVRRCTSLVACAARTSVVVRPLSSSSSSKRPMTRFVQYPFDKTKMEEVTAWSQGCSNTTLAAIRAVPGVSNVEVSFCPGEGWLALRYLFDDLEDLQAFPTTEAFKQAQANMKEHSHYDHTREPQEFKGFFLKDV